MVDGRCWILDLREAKCGVEIYSDIKAKFFGAMWASHPTKLGFCIGIYVTLIVGHDAHIMP